MKRKRMEALLAEIDAHPERHFQGNWTSISNWEPKLKEEEGQLINCGTTGCIAGLASFRYAPVGTKFYNERLDLPGGENYRGNGSIEYSSYGGEALGLTLAERNYLFSGDRSLTSIKAFVAIKGKEARQAWLNNWLESTEV